MCGRYTSGLVTVGQMEAAITGLVGGKFQATPATPVTSTLVVAGGGQVGGLLARAGIEAAQEVPGGIQVSQAAKANRCTCSQQTNTT